MHILCTYAHNFINSGIFLTFMPVNDKQPSFEENVKNSFLRVKEHISILERELRTDRVFVIKQNNQIRFLLDEMGQISAENRELRQELSLFKSKSSIGNGGVYSDIHSFIHSLNIHSTDIQTKSSTNKGIKEANLIIDKPNNMPFIGQVAAQNDPNTEILHAESSLRQNLHLDPHEEIIKVENRQILEDKQQGSEPNDSKILLTEKRIAKNEVEYGEMPEEKPSLAQKKIEEIFSCQEKSISPGKQNLIAEFKPPLRRSSAGNLLHGHSSIVGLKSEINSLFFSLSKQEFLTFLTVYQLEEDLEGYVSYIDVAAKLGLTEGCIRTYISSLIKKSIPILKTKHNNKVVYLSISKDFRALSIKKDLMALYYKADPTQKTLS